MPSRRTLMLALLPAACAAPPVSAPLPLGSRGLKVAAESWHTDLCLPAAEVLRGPLGPVAAEAAGAAAFAFGFGLESWMRAARPGSAEALGALAGGPAVVSVRALAGPVPPGAEEAVPLRLPEGGHLAIARFVAGQMEGGLPPAPASGAMLLVPSRLRYTLDLTCNTWVMRALSEAGLPVPVSGIRLRGEAMTAIRAEAARQAGA